MEKSHIVSILINHKQMRTAMPNALPFAMRNAMRIGMRNPMPCSCSCSYREKNNLHPPTSSTQTLRARAANRGGWMG